MVKRKLANGFNTRSADPACASVASWFFHVLTAAGECRQC
jgi:hypothetical protein